MRPDATWLDDPARVYPVTLDPDFYWQGDGSERFHGANQDCYLSGGVQATTSYCAATTLAIGYYNRPYRANLRFDLAAAIPSYANVTNAQLAMFLPGSSTHAAINSRVHTITSDWDNTATWNNRKTNTPWSTSGGGGDVSTAANLTGTVNPSVGNANYWYYWNTPLDAVNGWIKGTLPNYGLQVSADSEVAATNAYSFVSTDGNQASWPALDVTWTPDTTAPTNIGADGIGSPAKPILGGSQAVSMTASATDDISGVKSFVLIGDNGPTVATATVACSATNCPLSGSAPLSFNTSGVSEGKHTLAVKATDLAGNASSSDPWTVYVDRTAPAFAAGTAITATPGDTGTVLTWSMANDPALADGSPSYGVASYDYRYTVGGVTSAWATVSGNQVQVPTINGTASVDLVATDQAGNRSATFTGTATVPTMTGFVQGGLYRDSSNGMVWEYENGTKAWISSPAAADQYGFDLTKATAVTTATLNAVPTAQAINYTEDSDDDDGGLDWDPTENASPSSTARTSAAAAAPTPTPAPGLDPNTYSCLKSGATMRNAGKKYALGYCYANASITVTGAYLTTIFVKATNSTKQVNFNMGLVGGNYKNCGFLQSTTSLKKDSSGNPTGSGNPQPNASAKCGLNRPINENVFASTIYPDSKYVSGASQIAEVKSDRSCPRFRNVGWTSGIPYDQVRDKDENVVDVPHDSKVQVRWRTIQRDFVMTRYPPSGSDKDPRYADWAFMPANCFKQLPQKGFTARDAPGGVPSNQDKCADPAKTFPQDCPPAKTPKPGV